MNKTILKYLFLLSLLLGCVCYRTAQGDVLDLLSDVTGSCVITISAPTLTFEDFSNHVKSGTSYGDIQVGTVNCNEEGTQVFLASSKGGLTLNDGECGVAGIRCVHYVATAAVRGWGNDIYSILLAQGHTTESLYSLGSVAANGTANIFLNVTPIENKTNLDAGWYSDIIHIGVGKKI